VTNVLRSFGPNSIIVFKFPVGPRTTNLTPEERTRKDLTYENAVDIRERCKAVEDVSPMIFANGMVNVHYKGNDMYDVNLMGVEEAYARGGQVDMHLGRFFTDEEGRHRMPVAVVGADVKKGSTPTWTRSARPSWSTATSFWWSAPCCARPLRSSATPITACWCPTA
jgi:putative ABC transport system permease protein